MKMESRNQDSGYPAEFFDHGRKASVLLAVAKPAALFLRGNLGRHQFPEIHIDPKTDAEGSARSFAFLRHFRKPFRLHRRIQIDKSPIRKHLFKNASVLDGTVINHLIRGKTDSHRQIIFLCGNHLRPEAVLPEMIQKPRERIGFHRAGRNRMFSPSRLQSALKKRNVLIQFLFFNFIIRGLHQAFSTFFSPNGPACVCAFIRMYFCSASSQSSIVSMSCTSFSCRTSGTMSSTSVVRPRKKASLLHA